MSSVKETIQAGSFKEFHEPGDFFRLLATTGPVNVEFYYMGRETVDVEGVEAGYAEYFRGEGQSPFDRVRIYSASTQSVQFVTRNGSDVRYDRGASSVSGSVDLNPATLAALEYTSIRPEAATGFLNQSLTLVANTAQQIFAPGANPNGVILKSLLSQVTSGSAVDIAYIAKATAPATVFDGDPVSSVIVEPVVTGTNFFTARIRADELIPAGQGLYIIADTAMTLKVRARWKAL